MAEKDVSASQKALKARIRAKKEETSFCKVRKLAIREIERKMAQASWVRQ